MFARIVRMRIKSTDTSQLTQTLENEVLPVLKSQRGFRDELIFVAPDRKEAVGISIWDSQQDAEAYQKTGFTEVQRIIKTVAEGTPQVETFEVAHSTIQKITRSAGGR